MKGFSCKTSRDELDRSPPRSHRITVVVYTKVLCLWMECCCVDFLLWTKHKSRHGDPISRPKRIPTRVVSSGSQRECYYLF
jgi:hypothetical protein